MAVWSSLLVKNFGKLSFPKAAFAMFRNEFKIKTGIVVPVRKSHGEANTMVIKNSSFEYTKFKDMLNFYVLLGAIPLLCIITYVNLFIGPAELALIPEGYDPKPYEYYKHPITRFIAKYFSISEQERHERNLHNIFYIYERDNIRALTNKVLDLMKQNEDYQSWYYDKPTVKYGRKMRDDIEYIKDNKTTTGGWVD